MSLFTSDDPRINRKGRPRKGTAIADILNKISEEREKEDGPTNLEQLMRETYRNAPFPSMLVVWKREAYQLLQPNTEQPTSEEPDHE